MMRNATHTPALNQQFLSVLREIAAEEAHVYDELADIFIEGYARAFSGQEITAFSIDWKRGNIHMSLQEGGKEHQMVNPPWEDRMDTLDWLPLARISIWLFAIFTHGTFSKGKDPYGYYDKVEWSDLSYFAQYQNGNEVFHYTGPSYTKVVLPSGKYFIQRRDGSRSAYDAQGNFRHGILPNGRVVSEKSWLRIYPF